MYWSMVLLLVSASALMPAAQADSIPATGMAQPFQAKPFKVQAQAADKSSDAPTPARSRGATPIQVDARYDLYEHAPSALWQASGSGKLPFPGEAGDRRGYVRALSKATLSTGTTAVRLVQSHPEGRGRGWVSGTYPPIILGDDMRFRAVAGFLEGAGGSDGVRFSVRVREGRRNYRLLSQLVGPDQQVNLEGDLSRWSGKTVSIVLRVDAGGTATRDLSVWASPRLEVAH